MTFITCVDKNGGIGLNGTLPFHNKEDLQFFKSITLNKKILVGRKTFEGLPPLKNREIYVLTKQKPGILQGLESIWGGDIKFSAVEDNIHYIYSIDQIPPDCIVSGGAAVYKLLWEKCTKLYLTRLENSYDCDAFFPFNETEIDSKFASKKLVKMIDGGAIWEYSNS